MRCSRSVAEHNVEHNAEHDAEYDSAESDQAETQRTVARTAMLRGSHTAAIHAGNARHASRVETGHMEALGRWRVPVILFLGVYLFSGLSRIATSFDSRWTVYIAMNIWNHGDTNLDEYPAAIRQNDYYALECVDARGNVRTGPPETCNGHWYDSYPIGGTVLATAVDRRRGRRDEAARTRCSAHFHSSQPVIAGFLHGDYDIAHPLIEMEVASFLLAASRGDDVPHRAAISAGRSER